MSARIRVGVFLGGPSSEHEVSLKTGGLMLARLDRNRFEPLRVFVDRDRSWHFDKHAPAFRPGADAPLPWRPDIALLGLHGAYGEDGEIQAELEALGIPYTGSGPAASKLAMNKVAAKEVFRKAKLPVVAEVTLSAGEPGDAAERVATSLKSPWVIKPRDGGSSVGVEIAKERAALSSSLAKVLAMGPVIVEPFVAGRELTCGVLEDPKTGKAVALPPTEIRPKGDGFFDFTAKYTPGMSEEITPAPLTAAETKKVQEVALAAHEALGCRAYSRSDFILSATEGLVLLETNTLPGMTETSLLPQEAAAVGIGYTELLTRLLELAQKR